MAKRKELDDAGDPEPDIKDVELLMEQLDAGEDPAPIAAPPPPAETVLTYTPASAEPDAPHALDAAPRNSRIAVFAEGAYLMQPDFAQPQKLPPEDLATRLLPIGAQLTKRGEGCFEGVQLNAAEKHPPLILDTAVALIRGFVNHFHAASAKGQGTDTNGNVL